MSRSVAKDNSWQKFDSRLVGQDVYKRQVQRSLLEEVADLHGVPEGAYNIRANGHLASRQTTANISIESKTDVSLSLIHIYVGSSHPGAEAGPKGLAVRHFKRHARWVQNVVRKFGPYLSWAQYI